MFDAERRPASIHIDAGLAGPLFMLAAALLFTLLSIFVKLLGPDIRVWDIGCYRFLGGALVLITLFGRRGNPYRGHDTRLLIIRGCTGSAAYIAMVTAIRLLPVSTALVGILFMGDPTGWRFWTGGGLILGSVVTLDRLRSQAE